MLNLPMFNLTPLQTLFFGVFQIAIGIGILFFPLSNFHVIAWVLILFGSMFIFLAIYLWFTAKINQALNRSTKKDLK